MTPFFHSINAVRKVLVHHMPRRYFSKCVLRWSRTRLPGPLARMQNEWFARLAHIDVSEAEWTPAQYPTLNAFFTRKLRVDARPIDADPLTAVFPCDGHLGAFGRIEGTTLVQAKGIDYEIRHLLMDETWAKRFENGHFFTIYLSPRDYHRVHFPLSGRVLHIRHIPGHAGTSYPVGPWSVANIQRLYCRNERMVTYIQTLSGLVAVVMVAAAGVGNMTLSFGPSDLSADDRVREFAQDLDIAVEKGDECGIFHLGSTVVLLFERFPWQFEPLEVGQSVRMGRPMGKIQ